MKLIVAGSRDLLADAGLVDELTKFFRINHQIKEVVSGGSGAVDQAGEEWSQLFLEKEPKIFQADWHHDGKAAGPLRNGRMAKYADALLLIWDGKSKGSFSMKQEMVKQDKPIFEVVLRG